jgi:uncharacterized protein
MPVPVTALYGGLNAIFNIVLASRVSSGRREKRVSLGLGDAREMEVLVRTHANNAEFMPLGIVMLLVAELMSGSSTWLHVAGGTLLLARVLHAIGMPRRAPNPFRVAGTAGTWIIIAAMGVWVIVLRYQG